MALALPVGFSRPDKAQTEDERFVQPRFSSCSSVAQSVVPSAIIVENGLHDLAAVLIDPNVVLLSVLDSGELVVGAAPVAIDVGDEVPHRPNLAGAFGVVGIGG